MKIKMIGTGSMISSDNPACYLINDRVLIDLPNGVVKILKKENCFENITDIFITHIHGDHIFDLPFIFLDRFKNNKQLNVYIDRKWFNKIKQLVKLAFPREYYNIFYNSQIKFLDNKLNYNIDNLMICRKLMNHGHMKPSYGYLLSENNKKVLFTGDTCLCNNLINILPYIDAVICDCTMIQGNNKHIGVDNIIRILSDYPKLKVIPSHMGINAKKSLKKLKQKNLNVKNDLDELIL